MPLRSQIFRDRLFSSAYCTMVLCFVAVVIELYSLFCLIPFGKQIGEQVSKYSYAFPGTTPSYKEEAMFSGVLAVPCSVHSDFHIVEATEGFNRAGISHFNGQSKSINRAFALVSHGISFYGDTTFTINKSCEVCFVHPEMQDTTNRIKLQEFFSAKLPKSGDIRPSKIEDNPVPSSAKAWACVTTKGQPRKG